MENNMEQFSAEQMREEYAKYVKDICRRYGLCGNVIFDLPSPIADSDRNRPYIIVGMDPDILDDLQVTKFRPDEILRAQQRNQKLFYPKIWVYDLMENRNDIRAQQDMVDYCHTAEFISQLYQEYHMPVPDKLRYSEVNQLMEYRTRLDDPAADPYLRHRCRKALDIFFRREKANSPFRRKWRSYYRSEHFPDNKGALARLLGYFRRNSNKTSVKRLMEVNGALRKLEMQEHEYKLFAKLMGEKHPDVIFSVSEKDIVDHGLVGRSDAFGRAVTGEEYAVVRKERFAEESFAALANLRPAYWEFRDVYYKAADEPLVAGIYNRITLSYAKCNTLMEMKERGDLRLTKIPVTDFMNFVSLAKANNLRFYIDNDGDFAKPSLEIINVIYNGHQEEMLAGIKDRMVHDKVAFSHVLSKRDPTLTEKLRALELSKRSKEQDRSPNTYSR